MCKYASKPEKSGATLNSIIKSVFQKQRESEDRISFFRKLMVQSTERRDIGLGETSRLLAADRGKEARHYSCSFNFARQNLDVRAGSLEMDDFGLVLHAKSVIWLFANRENEAANHEFGEEMKECHNLVEFCQRFTYTSGTLGKRKEWKKWLIVFFPNFTVHKPKGPPTLAYMEYCRYQLLKYTDYTPQMLDDAEQLGVANLYCVQSWEILKNDPQIAQAAKLDIELGSSLKFIREEVVQEGAAVEEAPEQVQQGWQMYTEAENIKPEHEEAEVFIDPDYDWTIPRLTYTQEQLKNGVMMVGRDCRSKGARW
jgi:hypothetical protein